MGSPEEYVSKICQALKLSNDTENKTYDILVRLRKQDLLKNKGSIGIAAAAVYAACLYTKDLRSQRQVADAAGITEATVRNRYKEILEVL